MGKFKVGDRVKILSGVEGSDEVGDIKTIQASDSDSYPGQSEGDILYYTGQGRSDPYFDHELELVTTYKENKPMARRTFKLVKDNPELKKGALLQEKCDDGTQQYVVINKEFAHKGDRVDYEIPNRDLVEEQPQFFVEVFKVEPEYMTQQEIDAYKAFTKTLKPAKRTSTKRIKKVK